jgi:DNA helicase-2/ATP-dependent DNA helicase PcrA
MRLKRHPELRSALAELANREPGRLDKDMEVAAPPANVLATRGDLQHLFGDAVLLERVARAARLAPGDVSETLDRTRTQFSARAEEEWAHVTDRRRLLAVDGRKLDEGTASEFASTIDVEDYAVLFELARLRAAKRSRLSAARMTTYDRLLLDEAQELAPLELALLGRSLEPNGTLIVAGDADQHTDETSSFRGWESTMTELGRPEHATVRFEIGYRCPPDVVELAHAILGAPAVAPSAAAVSTGACRRFDDEAAIFAWMTRDLRHLLRRDRRASIAMVCRSPRTARRITEGLHAAEIPARLVFDGRFFARGVVQVTTVEEVKGLEFDFVIIPDAGMHDYPNDPAARRAMYVTVTRARHQVVVACVGEVSTLGGGYLWTALHRRKSLGQQLWNLDDPSRVV